MGILPRTPAPLKVRQSDGSSVRKALAMTKWPFLPLLLSALFALICDGAAQAQYVRPGVNPALRPKFSPYLNLLRTDVDPALNYYGLVRPQMDFYSSIQQLGQQQSALATQQQDLLGPTALPATGHTTGFLNHNRYFMTRSGVAAGAARFASPQLSSQSITARTAPTTPRTR
jgi:hypothetical protein